VPSSQRIFSGAERSFPSAALKPGDYEKKKGNKRGEATCLPVVLCRKKPTQNSYRRANCITRGLVERPL
jgi:hypothetical protein